MRRITWIRQLWTGSSPDQFDALGGIRLRQQACNRDGGEIGVTVVALAVGKSQLEDLGHGMNIGRRVVPQGAQVDMLQHIQGLEQYGCLRPGGLTTDLIARKGSANGRFA